jgi:cellulose synthase/poly-beta-1,6-N-acetylglucosamine synthase-like glycosyltransferase
VDVRILLFWSSVALIAYTYVVYPAILLVFHRVRAAQPRVTLAGELPAVTIVVPVFNEEAVLAEKLANLEATDYASGRLEAIVGSDGSTDGTNAMLSRLASGGVRAVLFPQRRGKAALLNDLVALASGDVIVFSDANAYYESDTVRRLVGPFADPTVGAVCGELILKADLATAGGRGEGLYWKYENALKRMESDLGTTLGAVGPVYAIRKRLFRRLPVGTPVVDDFVIPLAIIEQGYRVLYEPSALAYEKPSNSVYGEFRRKSRIGAQNFRGIPLFRAVLSPAYGFAAFALWSHKIIRWLVPVLMIAALVSSAALARGSSFYAAAAIAQASLIAAAAIGLLLETAGRRTGPFALPYYFVATNAALLVGLLQCLFGRPNVKWEIVR